MALVWTIVLNGVLGVASYILARSLFGQPRGWPRFFATAVIGWTWIILGCQLVGGLGILNRPALLAWVVLGFVLALVSWFLRPVATAARALGPISWLSRPWLIVISALLALVRHGVSKHQKQASDQSTDLIVGDDRLAIRSPGSDERFNLPSRLAFGLSIAAFTLILIPSLLGPVKVVSDGPIYHLYFAVQWWKSGALKLIPVVFGESAATYFPANGDLWFTWLLIGWGGDQLAKVGQAPFLILAALLVYTLAIRLGARRSAALIASCWFATVMPLLLFSFETNVDTIFTAGYLLTIWFYLDHAAGEGGRRSLALAALAAGAAMGTKPTGIVFVAPLLLLGGLVVAWPTGRKLSLSSRLTDAAIWLFLPLVTSGYWWVRNWWLTGNPLYPADVSALGWIGWYQRQAMSKSPYYVPVEFWQAFVDIMLAVLDPRLVPFWTAGLVGAWRWGGPSRPRDRWVWAAASLALLNIGLYWFVIPYRTQQRFMLQALGLAAIPLALLIDRSRWLAWTASGLLAVHLLTAQNWPFSALGREPPWDLSPRVPNAIPAMLQTPIYYPVGILALLLGAQALAWLYARGFEAGAKRRAWLPVAATIGLLCCWGAIWSNAMSGVRLDTFYPRFPEFYYGWLNLEQRVGPRPARIAYAGTNIPYYLFGRDLRHQVQYIPVSGAPYRLLHEYHAQAIASGQPYWPNPRPGWDRLNLDFDAWLQRLRSEQVDYLVVTRANPGEGPHNPNPADPLGFPIEREWAESRPDIFAPVYGQDQSDPSFRAFRVLPPAAI